MGHGDGAPFHVLTGAWPHRERLAVAAELAPEPLPVSVREGENLDDLVARVTERLPTERASLDLPNCDEAMRIVSRAYDRATVRTVDYRGDEVHLEVSGRPDVIAKLRAEAEALSNARSATD